MLDTFELKSWNERQWSTLQMSLTSADEGKRCNNVEAWLRDGIIQTDVTPMQFLMKTFKQNPSINIFQN